MTTRFKIQELEEADLVVDAVFESELAHAVSRELGRKRCPVALPVRRGPGAARSSERRRVRAAGTALAA